MEIPLTNSDKYALVSKKDYKRTTEYKWYIDSDGYIARTMDGLRMSHFIYGKPSNSFN